MQSETKHKENMRNQYTVEGFGPMDATEAYKLAKDMANSSGHSVDMKSERNTLTVAPDSL